MRDKVGETQLCVFVAGVDATNLMICCSWNPVVIRREVGFVAGSEPAQSAAVCLPALRQCV